MIAAERESELEEHAQEEQSARVLNHLDDRTLQAVHEVDAALQRILTGVYGLCEGCGHYLPVDRLRALPAARRCTECEARDEQKTAAPAEEPDIASTAPIPPDLSGLDDTEWVQVIRDHLKENGRIDTEELRIVCRKRVVYLTGALPSEAEHQILLKIVTDVLGLTQIVDRIQVEELLWEREDRSKETPPELLVAGQDSPGTEDIVESGEEEKDFIAPMSLRAFYQKREYYSPERSIPEACWLMNDKNLGCLVVESNNNMCGILADRDIATKLAEEQRDPLTTMVEEVMISEITSRTSRSTEMRTGSRVHTHHVRRIPIMDTLETVLEVVTMDDLITLLRNEISEMGNVVRNVSA